MARLLELAARYKATHDQFQSPQQDAGNSSDTSSESDEPVPEGEFEIEQLLCSDTDGAVLVKWVGHEVPTWELAAAMPAATCEAYRRQGRVELWEYLALLDVAC